MEVVDVAEEVFVEHMVVSAVCAVYKATQSGIVRCA